MASTDIGTYDVLSFEGTISALNDTVEMNCQGASSAVIDIKGTFNGVLEVVGSGEVIEVADRSQGGRLVFKTGVGSLGENKIRNNGEAIDAEYRVVAGGRSLTVKAIEWTSGSCEVKIITSKSASIVFINGPVHNALEEAIRSGRAYSVGTGNVSLSNQTLNMIFSNPSDSNVNCFVARRRFSNDRTSNQDMIQTGLVTTFSDLTGATQVTPNNLKTGGGVSVVDFEYKIDSSPLGTPVIETPLPLNGVPFADSEIRLVQPGQKFAYTIEGLGGGNNTSNVAATFIWYEETVN